MFVITREQYHMDEAEGLLEQLRATGCTATIVNDRTANRLFVKWFSETKPEHVGRNEWVREVSTRK